MQSVEGERAKLKITVLERTSNTEVAGAYGSARFKQGGGFGPCPSFKDGEEFVLDGLSKPGRFCDWAWTDIHRGPCAPRRSAANTTS